ncbi:glycosyltransferase family 2 protein [Onishia taeanensis]
MKISIAMATYNGAQYIQEQLQSFVDQTRQPDELIITDDCSNDQTEAIVREFAKVAPFKVDFFRNEVNLGYCGNFNAALLKTTGDIVFLSDQDDVWLPNKIEHMLDVAEHHSEMLAVMNDAVLTDGNLNEVGLTKVGQIRSMGRTTESFVMGCCCAVRRELLDMCLPIPGDYKAHDNWIVGFADGLNAKVVDEMPLQYYRRHESNESQFIANRITKVTRHYAFMHTLKTLFSADSIEQAITHRAQLVLLLQGIQRAQEVAAEKYYTGLKKFFTTTQERLSTLEQRIAVRRKSLIPRSVAALCLFFQRGYRNANGLQSMIRDIVG